MKPELFYENKNIINIFLTDALVIVLVQIDFCGLKDYRLNFDAYSIAVILLIK